MKKGENVQKIDLICKVQQGDVQAQGQLYEQYWEKLYRLAYAITKNKEDSMDIVQDALFPHSHTSTICETSMHLTHGFFKSCEITQKSI